MDFSAACGNAHLLVAAEQLHHVLRQLLLWGLLAGHNFRLGVRNGLHYGPVNVVHCLGLEQLRRPACQPNRERLSLTASTAHRHAYTALHSILL